MKLTLVHWSCNNWKKVEPAPQPEGYFPRNPQYRQTGWAFTPETTNIRGRFRMELECEGCGDTVELFLEPEGTRAS